MGGLQKAMKRRKRSAATGTSTSSILSLPRDMLASILASVASSSITDLVGSKLVCSGFKEASSDYLVFKKATLENLPSTSQTSYSKAKSDFLYQCEATGNLDATYNLGTYHYFSYGEFDVGRDLLKRSADMGHQESIYMLGMMLFFEETTKPEAIDLWKKIKSTEMDKCRWRAKKILRNMWINHRFCLQDPPCMNSLCRNGGKIGLPSKEEWSRCEEDWFCSETCKWTYEFNSFCKVFH